MKVDKLSPQQYRMVFLVDACVVTLINSKNIGQLNNR